MAWKKRSRVMAFLVTSLTALLAAWWITVTIAVGSDTGGPCPNDLTMGMTKLGWSWSEFGYVCEAKLSNGETYRYVARSVWPPKGLLDDAARAEQT
jgi:hypothetical protein